MKKSMRTVLFSSGKASNLLPFHGGVDFLYDGIGGHPTCVKWNDQLPTGRSMSNRPKSSTSSLHTAVVIPSRLFARHGRIPSRESLVVRITFPI